MNAWLKTYGSSFLENPEGKVWSHLSLIQGHPLQADFDCSSNMEEAKFAVTGDFNGDGKAEIAIANGSSGSKGNDFWVMDYNSPNGKWSHFDFDSSDDEDGAKFAVVGDFDGDGYDEIAVAKNSGASKGNDFWVMKYKDEKWDHYFCDFDSNPFEPAGTELISCKNSLNPSCLPNVPFNQLRLYPAASVTPIA